MGASTTSVGVPIENVYYLLCYAWDRLDEGALVNVSETRSTDLVNLFTRVLTTGTTHVLRRGLDRGYLVAAEEIAGIRGKLELGPTLKRDLLRKGQAFCAFDELSHDIPANQIIKATMLRLLSVDDLSKENRATVVELYRRLNGISDVFVSRQTFRSVVLHRNNAYYGFLMDVCWLIHQNLLPEEKSGSTVFRDFLRDERQMPLLFQKFVFNFLKRHTKCEVRSPQIRWQNLEGEESSLTYVPLMQTDIVLRDSARCLIIDTKFYQEPLQGQFKKTVHSANLYQMCAYMRNMQASPDEGYAVEGMLLYPTVREDVSLSFLIEGYKLRVSSLNLKQGWAGIHRDLLALVA